jgi:hypothetical protein
MSLPVDVQSLETLQEVHAALVEFGEDARQALGAMDMDIRRLVDWLEHDQRAYWQSQIKLRNQDLTDARSGLHRKKLSQMFGHEASTSEQRDLVREAKTRLEDAEERLERLRRWLPQFERAVAEYRGIANQLAEATGPGIEKSLALLSRMITAIDEYTRLAPPETTAARDVASLRPASVVRQPGPKQSVDSPEPGLRESSQVGSEAEQEKP